MYLSRFAFRLARLYSPAPSSQPVSIAHGDPPDPHARAHSCLEFSTAGARLDPDVAIAVAAKGSPGFPTITAWNQAVLVQAATP